MDWFAKATTWRGGASFPGFINLLFDESLQTFDAGGEEDRLREGAAVRAADRGGACRGRAARGDRARRPAVAGQHARARGVLAISREELVDELIFTPQRQPPSVAGRQGGLREGVRRVPPLRLDRHRHRSRPHRRSNSRFKKSDIVESILWPSKVISDQYDVTMIADDRREDVRRASSCARRATSSPMRTADTVGRSVRGGRRRTSRADEVAGLDDARGAGRRAEPGADRTG